MRIFLDMDQTLCDFDLHFTNHFGITPIQYKQKIFKENNEELNLDCPFEIYNERQQEIQKIFITSFWKMINSVDNFWETIPPTKGFKSIWKLVKKFDPIILTAVPITHPECEKAIYGKLKWIYTNLSNEIDVFILPLIDGNIADIPKHKFCWYVDDILVDDNEFIIRKWIEAGGIGIHYKDDEYTKAINILNWCIMQYESKLFFEPIYI